MQRRQLLGTTAALGALALTGRAPAVHAQDKKISLLTWNIPHLKDLIMAWGEEFKKRTGAELEWLDKKGPELPAFYQTQLVAGTPPDIINTQGALWLEYAAGGALMDLTPMFEQEPDVKARFNADYLKNWTYEDRNFMFPFYITKTLLFYNKKLFAEAGLSGPPQSFDDMLAFASKIKGGEKTGMLTLNFDWLYWPLMKMNGIDLLSPDLKEAVFNTDKTREVVERLAAGTADGSINKIAWTGRWVEPNGAFAAGTVGMHHAHSPAYFAIKGQGPWVGPETLGAAHAPGGWATPNSHGLGISKGSKNPELAWAFLKMMTEEDWAFRFGSIYKVLPGNAVADPKIIATFEKDDPLAVEVLKTQLEHTDKQTGNWRTAADSRIKEAFWPEMQAALLGQKPVKEALDEADRKVARVLSRA
ncbi:MAG TPA: extracellular solute-binding protein [Geminicoccaceae bacterium]|nr:extracellular solute-binding protein [Geminicoccus sp.]HMU52313.1 extracellular solute-binding protein [Geminicoccaceae bacterium]